MKRGEVSITIILSVIVMLAVVVMTLVFVFKVDISSYLGGLPGYSFNEEDELINLDDLPKDQIRTLCPIFVGEIRLTKYPLDNLDMIFIGNEGMEIKERSLIDENSNLIWEESKKRVMLRKPWFKRNQEVADLVGGDFVIQSKWTNDPNLRREHGEIPSVDDLNFLDGAYRLPGSKILCKLEDKKSEEIILPEFVTVRDKINLVKEDRFSLNRKKFVEKYPQDIDRYSPGLNNLKNIQEKEEIGVFDLHEEIPNSDKISAKGLKELDYISFLKFNGEIYIQFKEIGIFFPSKTSWILGDYWNAFSSFKNVPDEFILYGEDLKKINENIGEKVRDSCVKTDLEVDPPKYMKRYEQLEICFEKNTVSSPKGYSDCEFNSLLAAVAQIETGMGYPSLDPKKTVFNDNLLLGYDDPIVQGQEGDSPGPAKQIFGASLTLRKALNGNSNSYNFYCNEYMKEEKLDCVLSVYNQGVYSTEGLEYAGKVVDYLNLWKGEERLNCNE